MLLVGGEGGDRLAVDSSRPGVGPDLVQAAARLASSAMASKSCPFDQHLLALSASLLAPCHRPGRQPLLFSSARRSEAGPVLPVTWCLLQGLVSVGPFAGHRIPRRTRAAPDQTGGQWALPHLCHYYEPSDSSEASAGVSPLRLSHRLPSGPLEPTGPHLDHRPPALLLARLRTSEHSDLRGLPRSSRWRCRACQPQAPPDAPTVKGPFLFRRIHAQAVGSSASLLRARSPHQEAFQRFTFVPAHGFSSAPSDPGHPDALVLGYSNFNGQRRLHLLVIGTAGP